MGNWWSVVSNAVTPPQRRLSNGVVEQMENNYLQFGRRDNRRVEKRGSFFRPQASSSAALIQESREKQVPNASIRKPRFVVKRLSSFRLGDLQQPESCSR
ncbi:hypothetical protein SDJN02_14296, partial [Cucurbita argyrosperma subsp. argyrosperma]